VGWWGYGTRIAYSLPGRTKAIMASLEPDAAAIALAGSTYPISVATRVPKWIKAQQQCSAHQ